MELLSSITLLLLVLIALVYLFFLTKDHNSFKVDLDEEIDGKTIRDIMKQVW